MTGHLRLVATSEPPKDAAILGTFTFARCGGELIVLHDDDRCTVSAALLSILQMVTTQVVADPALRELLTEENQQVKLRGLLPGDMGPLFLGEFSAVRATEDALAELGRAQPNFSPPVRG